MGVLRDLKEQQSSPYLGEGIHANHATLIVVSGDNFSGYFDAEAATVTSNNSAQVFL